ncbi:tetratricopeptide repeat protein [Sphingomonas sp. MMSM20]|uniref:tetratricopeptide repeat protein n=1 Tax=Sphingomonas lycopersici TaxID=2951807 RepID=UPI002236F63D|nr:tetratricopeptide repeat protein [Sphingomonas lycopersici]MCW6532008.1 tetratricopeptide repeat protein [Sphingomonas lycopersici]
MALSPESNEAFLREVDDALRQDQALDFWRRYGRLLIVAIVGGLAVFGGYLFWQNRQHKAAEREGEQLQVAYDDLAAGKLDASAKTLAELAQSKSDGYRAAALFSQADIALRKEDLKGAAKQFAAIAGDQSMAKPFRDLALIRQTMAEFDTLKPDVVVSRLRGLAAPGNPYFGSAGELVALAYLKQGRRDLAMRLYNQIAATESVPESLRQRAVQMGAVLDTGAAQSGGAAGNEKAKQQ